MQTREQTLNNWLSQLFPKDKLNITLLTGDASFRQYYRLQTPDHTYIIMDAPPDKEPLLPFLAIQTLLSQSGIQVPLCLEKNITHGFLLLTDFGDDLLLHSLTPENTQATYLQAIDLLHQLQAIPLSVALTQFDDALILKELALFKDWFLNAYLKVDLAHEEQAMLNAQFTYLTKQIGQQPNVFIHRDYHSRNIMRLKDGTLGLIDFQDAMIGPIGYDLVSLLKDCYIQWPKHYLADWIDYFHRQAPAMHQDLDTATLTEYVALCGLQRHLKVLGIFSRLALRDQKTTYLQDIPLTLHYVMDYLKTNPDFKELHRFMQQRVQLP